MPKSINRILIFLTTLLAIFTAVATSGEQIITPLRGTTIEPILLKLGWSNVIVFNLANGYLISLFFWWLVVYLPEKQRRSVIRNNLTSNYQIFKEDIVSVLLLASNDSSDCSKLTNLASDFRCFRDHFKENKRQAWYAALNGLDEEKKRVIDFALIKFSTELSYTLSSLPIQDEKVHTELKYQQDSIHHLQMFTHLKYNDHKYLRNYIWSILACTCDRLGELDNDKFLSAINRL